MPGLEKSVQESDIPYQVFPAPTVNPVDFPLHPSLRCPSRKRGFTPGRNGPRVCHQASRFALLLLCVDPRPDLCFLKEEAVVSEAKNTRNPPISVVGGLVSPPNLV